jgi:hypothetical protein
VAVQSIPALASLLVFVSPGAIWARLRERRRPEVERTALVATTLVVLGSLGFGLFAGPVAIGVWWTLDRDWATLERLANDQPLQAADLRTALAALAAYALSGLAAAFALHHVLQRLKPGDHDIRNVSGWTQAIKVGEPPTTSAYAIALLNNGSSVEGFVLGYTPNAEINGREIVLQSPVRVQQIEGAPAVPDAVQAGIQRVVVNGDAIAALSILFVSHSDDPRGSKR